MRILLVNKFHWLKGGAEKYYFELGKLLKEHGHEIAYFSMQDEKNIVTGEKEFFVKKINVNGKNFLRAFSTIYSHRNKKKMEEAIEEFNPDIVHINLFQRQLTYSIIEPIKKKNIPIVFTAHDLQPICPASAMLCKGKICSKCLKNSKYYCFKNKCMKDSFLKSLLGAIEGNVYRKKKIYNKIDTIIAPSKFLSTMLKEEGINTKILTIPNYVEKVKSNNNAREEDYICYIGRLSKEKGINNLLYAFSKQKYGKLFIAGDGPEKENISKYIKQNNLENRVRLLGFINKEEVQKTIEKSSFVVVPSIWYENCPYSVLETLSIGKPIIGANIGGIPELIEDQKNGYLYEYNDTQKLAELIEKLFVNSDLRKKMGAYSKKMSQTRYNSEVYYKKIFKIYKELIDKC